MAVITWRNTPEQMSERIIGRQGHLRLANTCKRFMTPYVPADNLVLSQNVQVTADNESGHIKYNSPYAHYQYEGELYLDPVTGSSYSHTAKVPSGRRLTYQTYRHPKATDHWDKAMWQARKDDVIRDMQSYVRR